MKSILSGSITTWIGNATKQDRLALRRVVHSAERTIRVRIPNLQDIHIKRCGKRAKKITSDVSHPNNSLFTLLPSGRRYLLLRANTERMFLSPGYQTVAAILCLGLDVCALIVDNVC